MPPRMRDAPSAPAPGSARSGSSNQSLLRALRNAGMQPKLTVGASDDPHERAADRMADALLGTPAGAACACAEGDTAKDEPVRRKPGPQAGPSASALPILSGPGAPLDAASRSFFEPRLGRDLSSVRVHADAGADRQARLIGAEAFASGNRIAFREGAYQPGSARGRRLLAHELVHVMQARRAQNESDADPVLRRSGAEDVLRSSVTAREVASFSDADLRLAHGLLTAQLAGLSAQDPMRLAAEGNLATLRTVAATRRVALIDTADVPRTTGGEIGSVPVTFVAEEVAPASLGLPLSSLGVATPSGMSAHVAAMGSHSWFSPGAAFDTMLRPNYWSPLLPRPGMLTVDRLLNELPRDLYPYLQSHMQAIPVDSSFRASLVEDFGLQQADLARTPELIRRWNAGIATADELALLRQIAQFHINGVPADSPLVSYMTPNSPLTSVGERQFRVRIEVPRGQALDVSVPNAFNEQGANAGVFNPDEAEFLLSMNHEGRIVSVQRLAPGAEGLTRISPLLRHAGAIRWAGRVALVAGLAYGGYRVASAPPGQRGRVIGEEAGGLAFGIAGTALAAAGCVAFGVATAGVGLFLCGLAGGVAAGALGSSIGGVLGSDELRAELARMAETAAWAARRSPGSFAAGGLVTPLVMRGGYGGLLRSPWNVIQEQPPPR